MKYNLKLFYSITKAKLQIIFLLGFFFSNFLFAQDSHSVQFNGGILYPRSADDGISTSVQYNYSYSPDFDIYLSVGYSSWDKYHILFLEDYSTIQQETKFYSYSADNHLLIPLYVGTKIYLPETKLFAAFAILEIGYSYFSYDSYENIREVDPTTGEVISYYVDKSSKKEITTNLFNLGFGGGLSHQLTNRLNMILSYKINSGFNSDEFSLFNEESTSSSLSIGLEINI